MPTRTELETTAATNDNSSSSHRDKRRNTSSTTTETAAMDVDHESDEETVAASNGPKVYKTRVTLTLNVSCKNNPRAAVHQLLQSFMTQALRSDTLFAFLPWYSNGLGYQPLNNPTALPNDFNILQSYSPKLNPNKKQLQQTSYVSLYLQHTDDFVEFQKQHLKSSK